MVRLLYAIVVGLVVLAVIEAACRFQYPDDIELVPIPITAFCLNGRRSPTRRRVSPA